MEKVKLSDGTEILFQVDKNQEAFGTQGLQDKIETNLDKITSTGGKLLQESIEQIKENIEKIKPDQLEVEIGLSLGYEGSIFISKGKAEANISIKGIWNL